MSEKTVQKSAVDIKVENAVKMHKAKQQAEKQKKAIEAKVEEFFQKWQEAYNKAQKTNLKEDAKRAYQAFKIWRFYDKLNTIIVKVNDMVEQMQTINDALTMLDATNDILSEALNVDSVSSFRNVSRNIRKFDKKMRGMEVRMDKVSTLLDSLMDEKPSFWDRIFRRKKAEPDYMSVMSQAMAQANTSREADGESSNSLPPQGGVPTTNASATSSNSDLGVGGFITPPED